MLFILFDIEGVFLWPWAASLKQLLQTDRALALGEMGVFVGILAVGFVYLFKRGSLEWE
jgi:NADH-quinone oxidoreductase subunit A